MNSAYIIEENKKTNQPIWLYRIYTSALVGISEDLFFTSNDWDVGYFEWDGTAYNAKVYTAFAGLSHNGIDFNVDGEIMRPTLAASNVSREIQALLEQHDFLRGVRVDIWKTYRGVLTDAEAHREFTFYIDSHTSDIFSVRFNMIGKLDLLQRQMGRLFLRKCGAINYKGRGCWIENEDGTFTEPTGFLSDKYYFFQPETSITTVNTDETHQIFVQPLFVPSLDQTTDSIKLMLKLGKSSVPSYNSASILAFRLGSGTPENVNVVTVSKTVAEWETFLGHTIPADVWTEVEIPLSEFSDFTVNDLNTSRIILFSVQVQRDTTSTLYINTKDIEFIMNKYSIFGTGLADSCDRTTTDCRRHNNIGRFRGFPNIPKSN